MLLEAVFAAFVLTQLCYLAVNCGLCSLFVRRPANVVDERTLGRALEAASRRHERRPTRAHADGGYEPVDGYESVGGNEPIGGNETAAGVANPHATVAIEHGPGPRCRLPPTRLPRIRVLVPIARDRWDRLERTLSGVASQSYPVSLVDVTVAYDAPETSAPELGGAVGSNRPPGLEVRTVEVDRDALAADRSSNEWCFTGTGITRAAAGALTYAYDARSDAFDPDDVVTVLEPGTRLPVDAFELAVAGLEECDLVQTRRTVGNADDGPVPLLESMASAAWSDLCYRSSTGPYHLLGSGYFATARVLDDVDRWQREVEGDVPLGMAAYRRGCDLGVVDRYARAHCPTGLEAWVTQKRGWLREPYSYAFSRGRAGFDDVRFWTGACLAQALALATLVGLPAFVLVGMVGFGGANGGSPTLPLVVLVGFNGLVWAYYSVVAYRAAWDGLPFRSRWHRFGYSALVNPFAQTLYAVLWAVPICLALADAVRGDDVAPLR